VVQTTAASQPLLLVHEGVNYWFSPRVTGNRISSPNSVSSSISGNIDIIAQFQSNTSFIVQTLIMKGSGISYNYAFDISNTNNLRFIYGGFNIVNSSVTVNPLTLQYYRVTRDSSNGNVIFYTSLDGITFTQLGTTQTTAAGILPVNLNDISIGDNTAFAGNGAQGKIFRLTISNSIGGAPVVDFNPNQYNAANSQTQWVSTSGETWSLNVGTATTGYKGQIVTKTTIQGDGVDDQLNVSSFVYNQPLTIYSAANRLTPTSSASYLYDLGQNKITIYGNPNRAFAGLGPTFTPNLINSLGLFQFVVNSTNSVIATNNLAGTTFDAGTRTATALAIFGSFPTQAVNSNAIMNTFIISNSANNSTNRTSMYNYIRSINNSAF
jgi:hypothetical protein